MTAKINLIFFSCLVSGSVQKPKDPCRFLHKFSPEARYNNFKIPKIAK